MRVIFLSEREEKDMHLNKDSWYVRWYFWSLGICEEFSDNCSLTDRAENRGTNLCAFMRVILIYAPLILLLHAIVYAGAIATITVWPIYLFGLKGYILGVSAVVGLVILVFLVINLVWLLLDRRKTRIAAQQQAAKPTNADAANPGFFHIVRQWVVAKKQKVCPLITFDESNKEVRQ